MYIGHMLNQQVPWHQKNGLNEYGKPKYSDPVIISIRWEYKNSVVRTTSGETINSRGRAYTTVPINTDDTLTYDGQEWLIRMISPHFDEFGDLVFYMIYV